MSPLWVLPVCVLAVGSVVAAFVARRLVAEVVALRPATAELRAIGDEARALRAEADVARRRGASFALIPDRFRAARADSKLRRAAR